MTGANSPRIFLSYARRDGQAIAAALRALLSNPTRTGGRPLPVWQDLTSNFPAVEGVPVHTGWDIGHHDYTSIWFWQRLVGRLRIVGYFQDSGEGMPYYATEVKKLYVKNGWQRAGAVDYVPHDARGTLTGVRVASLRGGFEQLAAVGKLIQATGRTTLTAALDDQPALEGYRGHGVFTFAMLDALARGDRNGDGLISLTELIEHVDGLVPEITYKTWGKRQIPRSLFQGTNFTLAKQLSAIAPAPDEEIIISTTPTHVNTALLQVFKEAGGKENIVTELPPFTPVTLVKNERGWMLIARDGKALGYVAEGSLQILNLAR